MIDDPTGIQAGEKTAGVSAPAATNDVSAAIGQLERQLARFGREQFKLNTLVEEQQKQTQAALQQLRDVAREQRERLARQDDAAAQARARTILSFLPVLDNLEQALYSAQHLVERIERRPRPGLAQRLFPQPKPAIRAEEMRAWLSGLEMLRDRMLNALEESGAILMDCIDQPFDPNQHIAVDTTPATNTHPSGVVVSIVRRGFTSNGGVLRYAEVVVSK